MDGKVLAGVRLALSGAAPATETQLGARCEPAYAARIRFTGRQYGVLCRKTVRPDDCMIVSIESDVIDAGSGASRQWFVPPSEDPSTKGQPCETEVAAPAAPAASKDRVLFAFSSWGLGRL